MCGAYFAHGYNHARSKLRLSPSPQPATGADITDAELDAIYPESHNLGTHYQEIHRARLRKVIAAAMAHTSADVVVVPREEWKAYRKWEKDVRGVAFGMSRENECLATLDALRSSTNHEQKEARDAGD